MAPKYGYNHCEDSTRVLTIKKVDKKRCRIVHSCDFAIVNTYEDGKQKYIRFNKPKNYTWEKQAINLIMGEMNPYQVSKHLKVSDVAIYECVKQVRKKYIKVFGLPYESYAY